MYPNTQYLYNICSELPIARQTLFGHLNYLFRIQGHKKQFTTQKYEKQLCSSNHLLPNGKRALKHVPLVSTYSYQTITFGARKPVHIWTVRMLNGIPSPLPSHEFKQRSRASPIIQPDCVHLIHCVRYSNSVICATRLENAFLELQCIRYLNLNFECVCVFLSVVFFLIKQCVGQYFNIIKCQLNFKMPANDSNGQNGVCRYSDKSEQI